MLVRFDEQSDETKKVLEKEGYDPEEHDVVVIFKRHHQIKSKVKVVFYMVEKGSAQIWTKQAYEICQAKDKKMMDVVQPYLKEMFNMVSP